MTAADVDDGNDCMQLIASFPSIIRNMRPAVLKSGMHQDNMLLLYWWNIIRVESASSLLSAKGASVKCYGRTIKCVFIHWETIVMLMLLL